MAIERNKHISELNGFNTISLQLFLRAWPMALGLAVAFGVWQVRGLYALSSRLDVVEYSMDQGDRFTASDGLALEGRLREWHIADVEYRTREAQRDWVGVDSHIHLRIDAIERKVHTHLREQGYYEEIMEDN